MNDKQIFYTSPSKVYISDKKKDGTELIDKNGKKFTKVNIQIPELEGVWLSCLCYPPKTNYSPRRELEMVANEKYWISVTQNGDFYNFELSKVTDVLKIKIELLEQKVDYLYKTVSGNKAPVKEELPTIQEDEFFESDFDDMSL